MYGSFETPAKVTMPAPRVANTCNGPAAAKLAADHGWAIFPAKIEVAQKKSHKSAKYSGGANWGATSDPVQVRRDFDKFKGALVGIATLESKLLVLDLDDKNGVNGVEWLSAEIKKHGEWPDTVEGLSPSGGWHVYFQYPDFDPKTCAGEVAPGVDVRGHGGMIIAPPSVKPGGTKGYVWKNAPGVYEVAPAPQWLLDQLPHHNARPKTPARPANVPPAPPSPAYGEKALQGQIATLLAAPQGTRNAALNTAALKLGQLVPDGHLSESLIIEQLTEAAARIGLDAVETAATIKSGMSKGMTEPRGPGGDALARLGAGPGDYVPAGAMPLDARPRNTFRHNSLSLIRDDKDRPIWNAHNAIALLLQHDDWQGVLAFNEFTVRRVLLRAVPGQGGGVYPRPLEDDDYTAAQAWFNNNGFPKASMEIVRAAVRKVCRHQAFDPLRDYLDGLQWDGAPRLSSWLTTYCGAEPSAYVSEVGRRWCISAVARGFKPGVKADCMIVLEGAQGRRKSSALAALAGEDWFSDALPQMGDKDASSYLRGKWIIEVAELEAMRSQMDAIKAFISRQVEIYRPAYGREDVYEPRRCIFAGSTNKDDWQRDETGGRRFWPVRVGSIDVDAIARDRGQLWAEAVHLYRAGERWWLEGEEADQAQAEVAERRPDDPWRADIARVVEGRAEVTTKEVLHELHVLPVDMTPKLSKRVAQELVALGWVRDGRVTTGQMKGAYRYIPGEGK